LNFKLILILFVLINGGSLKALPFNLSGNASNNGLPAVSKNIYIQANGADTIVITDALGNFNLLVNPWDSSGSMRVFFLDCANDTTDTVISYAFNTRNVRVNLFGCSTLQRDKYFGVIHLNSTPIFGPDAILLRYKYLPENQKIQFEDTISIASDGKFEFLKDIVSDYLLKVIPRKDTSIFTATYFPNGITWDNKNSKTVGSHLNSSIIIDLKSYNRPRGIYSIEGSVKLDASLKKPGYSAIGIHLLDLNNNQVEFIYSDDSSDFKFQNIDSGDYKIWIDQCGVPTEPKLISLRGGANQITGIVLTANDNGISYDRFVGFTELKNEPEISIYPNPFYNALNLEVPSNSTIYIHDLMGQSIFQKSTISSGFQQLETDSWQSGIYIITIETQGQMYQRKLIKR